MFTPPPLRPPLICHLLSEWLLIRNKDRKATTCQQWLYISFSVCPLPAYKKKGFFYLENDFRANTFLLEDIFSTSFMKRLKNNSEYIVKTVATLTLGQCFSLYNQKKMDVFQLENVISFKRDIEPVNLYIHTPGKLDIMIQSIQTFIFVFRFSILGKRICYK